jgi:hypothetical protein
MNVIWIGFATAAKPNLFSHLIKWAQGTKFSHVYIKSFDKDSQRIVYYHASGVAVNCVGEHQFAKHEKVVAEFEFEISDDAYHKMMGFVIDCMGRPYGVKTIMGMAWMIICSWFGLKILNPVRDMGQTFVCSEFAAAVLDDLDDDNILSDVESATPKEMFEIVSKLPKNLNT